MTDEFLICSHCGEENLLGATRCLYCGMPLEQAFSIDGINKEHDALAEHLNPDDDQDLSEFMQDLRKENKSGSQPSPISLNVQPNESEKESHAAGVNEPGSSSDKTEDEGRIPDWLEKVRKRAKTESDASGDLVKKVSARDETLKENAQAEIGGEFDSWIAQIRENARRDAALPPEPGPDEESPEEEEGIPSWLRKLREIEHESQGETLDDLSSPERKEPLPDWLEQGVEAPDQDVQASSEDTLIKIDESTQPVHLGDLKQPVGDGKDQKDASKLEEKGTGKQPLETLGEAAGEAQISHLDLSAADQSAEEELEPIPADPYRYLQREQRERMELLKALVDGEGKSAYVQKSPRKVKTKTFRLILALILLVMTIFPFLSDDEAIFLQGSMQPASQAFHESVSELKAGSKILMVVDYQPSTSAEMETLAQPVLKHLVESSAEIYPMTTYPEGIWLAERLLQSDAIDDDSEVLVDSIQYLPGGRLGALNFAMKDFDPNASGVSKSYALAGINSLADFDRIIILVDSLQSGRNWLEQVGPHISGTPMLMISSTQEAAVLLPYYDSGQLGGLLSGYHDAGIYASMVGDGLESGNSWQAYQSGLLVMIILFLVGFVFRLESNPEHEAQKKN